MKLLKYIIIFLILNFGALAIGNSFMQNGPQTEWYLNLNKAPWTPEGWVFGAAWTSVMICFSVYMAYLYKQQPVLSVIGLFTIQFLLNISWNYVFFNQQFVSLGFLVLLLLTFIILVFSVLYKKSMTAKTLLIMPYLIWLSVATSLNAYILIKN